MVILTVPTGFQHQYEKTCSDNEELHYIENFLKKELWFAANGFNKSLSPDNYINASHWEIFLHNPSIQFSHTCKHIQFVSHKCLSNPQITLTLLSNTKGLHVWSFCVGKKEILLISVCHAPCTSSSTNLDNSTNQPDGSFGTSFM